MKRSPIKNPLTDRLAALSELLRLRMCRLLEREELSVGEVCRVFQVPQSTASRHLKTLTDAGWLARRADGTATYYRLPLQDLPDDWAILWRTVAGQIDANGQLDEDDRRLEAVLAERHTDSISYFGRVAGEWDRIRGELFGRSYAARAIPALLPPDWTVAYLGCGTGANAELIAPFVREVVCVDQSEPMLDAARERLARFENVRFVQGPLEALPLADRSVDAAMCLLVLHHVAEPADALREVRRVLKQPPPPPQAAALPRAAETSDPRPRAAEG
ncbi:MAG: methyltransferase domain-containing protein, partial [Planctomycetota bacterium]